ncbi:ribosomal biogenesis protein LAS1L [Seriola lalandi dorsalis]|uniref:ribosomal biogenesis protein LAS1L n=1 Tax=Seriola lalandi dorsalis TaxID=1841481 RepID=UPI000C6F5205|nr:ribosomal biogenesis protein LAS1L [Seriola lalandi dorsalis]XP_056241125.1 ribosomal biogenesis protein LAS1L [Seriola aureovittata]
MKKRSSEKKRHVVAWVNKAEWDQVLEYLYSKDPALQRFALQRISAWKCRYASSCPVAVDCTADLVRCQVLDRSGQLDGGDLVLLYGAALVRFVNLITERQQGRVARPLRRLAGNLNIPEWIVDLRHDFTHRKLPTLKWCRKGCKVVLEWLQHEYWSRQLGGGPNEDWESQSDGEDEEIDLKRQDDELIARQKEMEAYKNARGLLISFEKEQFQAFGGLPEDREKSLWPAPFAEMSWLLGEIKQFALESSDLLMDVLLEDGFLVPTVEQLEILGCETYASASPSPTEPRLPQTFLRFWLPLLKMLNSPAFVHLLLEKLFVELKLLTKDQNSHRAFYLSAWISEVMLCNSNKFEYHFETKGQRKARMKDRIFVNRIQLRWQQLLSACLDAPCISTPHLLQLILDDMEHPLPLETRQRLLQLCSIYTQTTHSEFDPSPEQKQQPIYTLESLHEKLQHSRHHSHPWRSRAESERSESSQEYKGADVQAEKAKLLRGSPWQLCADKVLWKNYPLGKVPGQSDDPSSLMVENYSTMTVFDQPVEMESNTTYSVPGVSAPVRTADGLLWNHSDVNKLKSGLQLF